MKKKKIIWIYKYIYLSIVKDYNSHPQSRGESSAEKNKQKIVKKNVKVK